MMDAERWVEVFLSGLVVIGIVAVVVLFALTPPEEKDGNSFVISEHYSVQMLCMDGFVFVNKWGKPRNNPITQVMGEKGLPLRCGDRIEEVVE